MGAMVGLCWLAVLPRSVHGLGRVIAQLLRIRGPLLGSVMHDTTRFCGLTREKGTGIAEIEVHVYY